MLHHVRKLVTCSRLSRGDL